MMTIMLINKSMVSDLRFSNKKSLIFSYPFEIFNTESAYSAISSELFCIIRQNNIKITHWCECDDCIKTICYRIVRDCNQNKDKTRLAKQISKQFFKEFNIDLRPYEELLGNALSKHKAPKQEEKIFYDITEDFDWPDGYFGKEGSCWWTCYKRSRDTLKYHGGLCLRIYSDNSDTNGIGRCWIYQDSEDSLVLFNAYGKELLEFRNILYSLLEISNSKMVRFYNYEDSSYPYVNNDKGCFLWGGDYNKYKNKESANVNWDVEDGIYSFRCKDCGDWVNFDYINEDNICFGCA